MKRSFLQKTFWAAAVLSSASADGFCQGSRTNGRSGPEMTLYRNGRIYTNDPSDPWAAAMLVRGEEIIAVATKTN